MQSTHARGGGYRENSKVNGGEKKGDSGAVKGRKAKGWWLKVKRRRERRRKVKGYVNKTKDLKRGKAGRAAEEGLFRSQSGGGWEQSL